MNLLVALSQASAPATFPASDFSYLRSLIGLVAVVALLAAFLWMLKRGAFGLAGRRKPGLLQVETAVPLGERRSLVVVAVEGRRLLLGLTPGHVGLITELGPPPASFGETLDRSMSASGRPS